MKHALPVVAALALATACPPASAEPVRRHALGMDMVRLLDKAQFEPDDGMLNLFYQGYLTRNTAWSIGYARGEQGSIPELGYKIYNQEYQNGTFWQVGAASVDVDGTTYNHEPAVWGAFGFERMPAPNLVVSGSARAMVGIDHPNTGRKDIIFTPVLAVMFTF